MGSKFPQCSEDNSQEFLTCGVVRRTDQEVNFTKTKHSKEKWKVLYTPPLPPSVSPGLTLSHRKRLQPHDPCLTQVPHPI